MKQIYPPYSRYEVGCLEVASGHQMSHQALDSGRYHDSRRMTYERLSDWMVCDPPNGYDSDDNVLHRGMRFITEWKLDYAQDWTGMIKLKFVCANIF